MSLKKQKNSYGILTALLLVFTAPTHAQEVTGTLGSPSATTTISGKQLPAPGPKFGGVIKKNAAESKAWWAPRVVPPKSAPNVLLIMTDDVGYGAHEYLWWCYSYALPRPHCQVGFAIHLHELHFALFADPCCTHHWSQPPLGRLWSDL